MSKEIGERVFSVRTNAGLNQRDFATQLGTSSGGISQIESGKTMPGGDFLLRLHEKFGVDVTWLLTGQRLLAEHRIPLGALTAGIPASLLSAAPAACPPPAPALSTDEAELLSDYRESHPVVQRSIKTLLREAASSSGGGVASAPRRRKRA